ncbi:rhomboid family intramembrane serine protease [Candidatus Xianfuyuplasma coldseepsis]|uniref:Rhomboid family intramembrane serine protease n=1 Tax=Candidatus Xianfuyuplasma coldseepsis TaxID=2782163 RepID=A0A7L7KPZ7_9MOLU|nr:rhomboid family intramembrane serine protease [Xianfuyuplasma coldseepsis]QMS84509.1 rhomboid family intramembrane serine protease [Xianfuyuplasma coldseepsis]
MSIFARTGDWKSFWEQSPVSTVIFFLNTGFFLAVLVTGGFEASVIQQWGLLNPVLVLKQNEFWRLFTAPFLHWSIMHFASNMVLGIIVMSTALERTIGSRKFSIVYFSSLLISSTAVVVFSESFTQTTGASGAIFGVMGALLWLSIYRKDMLNYRDIQSIWVLIALQVVSTFASIGVSVSGHLGGLVAGFGISYLIIQRNIFKVLH